MQQSRHLDELAGAFATNAVHLTQRGLSTAQATRVLATEHGVPIAVVQWLLSLHCGSCAER